MKYNFDEIVDRRNTNSVKWDSVDPEVIPMWVADMDFKTCLEIQNALFKKVSTGIFGYEYLPSEFREAVKNWMADRHQFYVKNQNILPAPGILLTISAIIRTYVKNGEQVILQAPVYDHFFGLIHKCGVNVITNDLKYQNGSFEMNFEDLELKASDPRTKMLILCNPHNPVGKVWTEHQLQKIAEICSKNNIIVLSDEIHSDIVFNGFKHVPFAKAAQEYDLLSFTCGSPCKTFNLAGLSSAYIISENENELEKIRDTFQMQETEWLNPFSATAMIAAYQFGQDWLSELKDYVYSNYLYLKDFIDMNIPEIKVIPLESTYLVWLDCSSLKIDSKELSERILSEAGVKVNAGTMYGAAGEGFLRINIGCPREILIEGLKRLSAFFNSDGIINFKHGK